MPLTWNDIDSKTTEFIIPRLYDMIFKSSPLLTRLRTKNNMLFEGGTFIKQPFIYDYLNGGAYAEGADFNTIGKDGAVVTNGIAYVQTDTALRFDIKKYEVNVTIQGGDAVLQAGPETVMSYSETKLVNAAGTMARYIGKDLFFGGSGAGTDTSALAINGLAIPISNAVAYPKTGGVLAGIPAANPGLLAYGTVLKTDIIDIDTGTNYVPSKNNTGLAGGVYGSAAAGAITNQEMQEAYGGATYGNSQPDLIVTTQPLWNSISNAQMLNRRYVPEDVDICKVGFMALQYMGAAVVVDQYAPAGYAWFLNTDYLQFWTTKLPKYSFGWSGWKHAQNNDNQVAQYFWAGNLVVNQPRLFSVIDANAA